MQQLDDGYSKTDNWRAFSWLGEFSPFARKPSENLKDFWARLPRVATRLETLAMKMSEEVIWHQSLPAFGIIRREASNSIAIHRN